MDTPTRGNEDRLSFSIIALPASVSNSFGHCLSVRGPAGPRGHLQSTASALYPVRSRGSLIFGLIRDDMSRLT